MSRQLELRLDSPDAAPRAVGGRKIVGVSSVRLGKGHINVYKLECGHIVERVGVPRRKVGAYTRCPRCSR